MGEQAPVGRRAATTVPAVDGIQVSVCSQGDGPAVVLVHGIPGSGAVWGPVAARLAGTARVLVPDLVGFGRSSRADSLDVLHADGQARVLAAVLDRLAVGSAAIVGHDFGAPVALALYRRRPDLVNGLGLLATNTFTDTPVPFPLSTVRWPVIGRLAGRALFSGPSLRMMLHGGVGRPRRRLDPAAHVGDRGQRRAIARIFAGSLRHLDELYAPVQDTLAKVDVPAFVLWGDRDPFFTVEQGRRTAASIAGAELTVLSGAGHFIPEERPAEVTDAITRLLNRAGRAPVEQH
jgi:pimeloyl-ACP methyl ester carboxylesterase